MRFLVTQTLKTWLTENEPQINSIAVVGGSSREPELSIFRQLYPSARIEFFGIENSCEETNFQEFDLNSDEYSSGDKFDFIICSQVLEHIWNLENSFRVFLQMTKPGGYRWVNVPASNFPHGSPN